MITDQQREFAESGVLGLSILMAVRAHEGQKRKDGFTPYVLHPLRVAQRLLARGFPLHMVIAALWHDILEDCDPEYGPLMKEMVERISLDLVPYKDQIIPLVGTLSIITSEGRSRASKYKLIIDQIASCELQEAATIIKFCDRTDNLLDMNDGVSTEFMNLYIAESECLVQDLSGYLSQKQESYRIQYDLNIAIQHAKIRALQKEMQEKVLGPCSSNQPSKNRS